MRLHVHINAACAVRMGEILEVDALIDMSTWTRSCDHFYSCRRKVRPRNRAL